MFLDNKTGEFDAFQHFKVSRSRFGKIMAWKDISVAEKWGCCFLSAKVEVFDVYVFFRTVQSIIGEFWRRQYYSFPVFWVITNITKIKSFQDILIPVTFRRNIFCWLTFTCYFLQLIFVKIFFLPFSVDIFLGEVPGYLNFYMEITHC